MPPISRNEALANLFKKMHYEKNAGRKNMQYIPYWGIGYDE